MIRQKDKNTPGFSKIIPATFVYIIDHVFAACIIIDFGTSFAANL